jgi:hypothetical protein
MVAIVHRPLKVIAFNAFGGSAMSSVTAAKLTNRCDSALRNTSQPHERFFIPVYHFYRAGRFPGRKGIPHKHVDLCCMYDMYT